MFKSLSNFSSFGAYKYIVSDGENVLLAYFDSESKTFKKDEDDSVIDESVMVIIEYMEVPYPSSYRKQRTV